MKYRRDAGRMDKPRRLKVKEMMLSLGITAFAMMAGAACYHQVLAADKPEVASVQPMEATAYCYGTIRCDGGAVRTGTCAGKPEWYGKVAAIYLDDNGSLGEFLGYFEILDTGGDDRITEGLVLDIYTPNYDACIEFGRRKVIVLLIDGEG